MEETPNLNYIRKLSKGDREFEKGLLNILKDEIAGEVESYNHNIRQANYGGTAEDVHKLCHKIGILGMKESYKIAKEYEAGLLSGNVSLRSDFESILKAMLHYIKKV